MTSLDARAQVPRPPGILVVTGASGAGKTTLVRALEQRGLAGVGCHYFDSIGIPAADEMTQRFGSPTGWQEWATSRWIARLSKNSNGHTVAVLDGQIRPSVARTALAAHGVVNAEIVLIECNHAERNARLRGPRAQPDLACPDMDRWAAYLRGQADALGLPIVDSSAPINASVDALIDHVNRLVDTTLRSRKVS